MSATMQRQTPPFRADQVGSLLRPDKLKAARLKFLGPDTPDQNLKPHNNPGLTEVEDACIREVVSMQERVGLRAATDGEFRRRSWWLDLIMSWDGMAANRQGTMELAWRNKEGVTQAFSRLWVNGPIRWRPSATVRAFQFLKAHTRVVPKVTVPAPILIHLFGLGDKGIREGHYKDIDQFWTDVTEAYRQEITALAEAGATYIQFDDTTIAFLCDPRLRDTFKGWGHDPDVLLKEYAQRINDVIAVAPKHVTFTMHQCRGNREGSWVAEGGYDPVADVLFNQVNVSGYFLEWDSERAGSFAPLRLLPKGKTVALGIVSSKTPQMESPDTLKRRIDEAAKFAPLEQLSLCPQCGFASSVKGNPLTEAEQERKLALLVGTATDVWGGA